MLETISKGFSLAKDFLKKQSTLSEENIAQALKEVRMSLLEADVEYSVVKDFLEKVKERALGVSVSTSVVDKKGRTHKLSPAEHFVGICYEELEKLMGPDVEELSFKGPISSIMMVGLQGSGKTTTSAKLARYLKEEKKKNPLLVAADIYRPGAVHQLQILGERLGIPVFSAEQKTPPEISRLGLQKARELKCDVVIFDTAGRLAIDEELMHELDDIKDLTNPDYIFLVVDAMIGQDAVHTAKEFNERLDLSGFILTKLDGDARGGAALSIKHVTHKPIRFLGLGEDLNSLEVFRPEGLASRILGMGDVVSLAKDFEKHVDEKEAEEDVKRLMRGQFSFDDFMKQLNLMKKIGSFQSILERLPGVRDIFGGMPQVDEREFTRFEAMVSSMTKDERKYPELLVKQKNRRLRIARGCGRSVGDIDTLVERFISMQKIMQGLGKNPEQLMKSPMFQQMSRMNQVTGSYGKNPADLMGLMGQGMPPHFGSPHDLHFGPGMQAQTAKNKISNKDKKDKRKNQKLARKKSKKRK